MLISLMRVTTISGLIRLFHLATSLQYEGLSVAGRLRIQELNLDGFGEEQERCMGRGCSAVNLSRQLTRG